MRPITIILLATVLMLGACRTPKLAKRLPGTWFIEHYDEYYPLTGERTGHDLDKPGTLSFSRKGKAGRQLSADRMHGSLTPYNGRSWSIADSLITLTDNAGNVTEQWFVAKDMIDYLQLVSVNNTKDTVRTMYIEKY